MKNNVVVVFDKTVFNKTIILLDLLNIMDLINKVDMVCLSPVGYGV